MRRSLMAVAWLVCVPVFGQMRTTIRFTPPNPKPGDTVTATISGVARSCPPHDATVSINGSTIAIEATVGVCPRPACPGDTPYTVTATYTAPTAVGIYDVEYYVADCPPFRSLDATRQLVVMFQCDLGHSLIADSTYVRAGDTVTLTWCDPAYFLTDYGYYVSSYRIYGSRSAGGPFTATADVQDHATTSAQVHPDTGTAYYYVESHGCRGVITMCGTGATDTTMLSNIVAISAAAADACLPSPTTLCVEKGRFAVTARWQTPDGHNGDGHAVAQTSDSGYFWFFNNGNVEVTAKVLNACSLSPPAFWVFAAGMTNVQVDITVTDMQSKITKHYSNPQGTPFATVFDTNAFRCP